MCKKIANPGGCWILRIQVENLTRGKFRGIGTPIGAMSTYSLYSSISGDSYSSISGDKIHKFAWQNSEFGSQIFLEAHDKVEIQL